MNDLETPMAEQGTLSQERLHALLNAQQEKAAQAAGTVNQFGSEFDRRMNALMRGEVPVGEDPDQYIFVDPSTIQSLVDERRNVIKRATGKYGGMRLQPMGDKSTLGRNMVGGGDESAQLSEDRFADLRTEEDAEQMLHAGAHESAHGSQVAMPIELLEGHAEAKANVVLGRSINWRRPGQPRGLYGEGQDLIICASNELTWERVDAIMTGRRDVGELLAVIADGNEALAKQAEHYQEN